MFQQQLPLVGRDADLRLLELVLDRAAVGSGSVALISGEAGIGKTRLCQELGRSQRDRGSQVLLGRAFPEETAISFGAIADTLRAARRGEPPMWQAASARASVLWAIAPELATTSDVERRSFDHPVLFEALLDAVDEAAGDRVTLWVLEDLHWADEATWEFVRYAARRVAGMGLVLGVTYREEELGAAHPWWGNLVRLQRDPSVVHVPLQRLSAADGERLVRALGAVAAPGVGGHDPPAQRRHAAAGAGAGEPGGALGGGAGPARRRAGHRRGTGGAAGPRPHGSCWRWRRWPAWRWTRSCWGPCGPRRQRMRWLGRGCWSGRVGACASGIPCCGRRPTRPSRRSGGARSTGSSPRRCPAALRRSSASPAIWSAPGGPRPRCRPSRRAPPRRGGLGTWAAAPRCILRRCSWPAGTRRWPLAGPGCRRRRSASCFGRIEPDHIMVFGKSGGGGLAAATALMARDRGGPALAHQILIYPMLDDRELTVSSKYEGVIWDRTSNRTGWTAMLGEDCGGPDVSPYAAPARATDLRGLPPAYLETGSSEVFRDEIIDYAAHLAQAGVPMELHSWAGGYHGFELTAPDAQISRAAIAARTSYLRRALRPAKPPGVAL